MFAPVHHGLEGLAAERIDAFCRGEIRWRIVQDGLDIELPTPNARNFRIAQFTTRKTMIP